MRNLQNSRIKTGELSLIGTKAKNLYLLIKAGYCVPDTFVLSIKDLKTFFKSNNLKNKIRSILKSTIPVYEQEEKIFTLIMQTEMSESVRNSICNLIETRPGTKWAVRSSSTLEDLEKSSFAGLYDSYLNNEGVEAVINAVKKCCASFFNERAIIYRKDRKMSEDRPRMAVIIQKMIHPMFSGVLFTKSPFNVNSENMELEYCDGYGDKLVSGKVTPVNLKIDRKNLQIKNIEKEGAEVTEKLKSCIQELAKTGIKIENFFGKPQDIEWAFDGLTTWILQSRPVNKVINKSDSDINKVWTRANIGEILPDVTSPFTWGVFKVILLNSKINQLEQINQSKLPFKTINGRVYISLRQFLDSFCYLPFVTPSMMELVLGLPCYENYKYNRPMDLGVIAARIVYISDLVGIFPRLRNLEKKIPSLKNISSESIDDLIEWCAKYFNLHRKCTAYAIAAFSAIVSILKKEKTIDVNSFVPLILRAGAPMQTATQGIELRGIAGFLEKNCVEVKKLILTESIEKLNVETIKSVKGGEEFLKIINKFLQSHGARAVGEFELSKPRWSEDLSFIFTILKMHLSNNRNDVPNINKDSILSLIKKFSYLDQVLLRMLLHSYSRYSAMRENVKYKLMEGFALIRKQVKNGALLLCEKNIIDKCDDVFFLEPNEYVNCLSDICEKRVMKELINKRKNDNKIWAGLKESGDVNEDDNDFGKEVSKQKLKGIACSPGIFTGFARVIDDVTKINELQKNEILVTHHTDPGWTPIFLMCGAIVTEIGGFLSHGATVAREYQIPAIAGVKNVTTIIKTGDKICVNGNSGIVTKIMEKNC